MYVKQHYNKINRKAEYWEKSTYKVNKALVSTIHLSYSYLVDSQEIYKKKKYNLREKKLKNMNSFNKRKLNGKVTY